MDNYNYNYRPENYQLLENSIQKINQQYYNNFSNSYQLYGLKTYDRGNRIDYNERNYPQTIFYRNNIDSLSIDEIEDFGISYSRNLKRNFPIINNNQNNINIPKVPKDTNKIPKDSIKSKQNDHTINKYRFRQTNNNYNNITTINNNNYNKINSINIIFDANNIYNNDYIQYNDFNNINDINEYNEINDINFIGNSENNNINSNQKITINTEDKSVRNVEKQPKDNYKNYSDSLNQISFKLCKSNNNLIRLKKNEGKEKKLQDKSFTISNI